MNNGLRRTNTSGYKGVSLTQRHTWRAQVTVEGRVTNLGNFPDKMAAVAAYETQVNYMRAHGLKVGV